MLGSWLILQIHGFVIDDVLNGARAAEVQDSKHARGPFTLQYGAGVVKFRKVQIKPLVPIRLGED